MLLASFSQYFFGISIFVLSVFLVLLVLVQRGRGGGLVGALGGPGGQSALGTKAGDLFTRITIVVAALWIFLCASAVRVLNPSNSNPLSGLTTDISAQATGSASAGIGDSSPATSPAKDTATTAPAAPPESAGDKPAENQTPTDKPADSKPAEDKPADSKPADSKPADATNTPAAPAAATPPAATPPADSAPAAPQAPAADPK